MSFRGRWLKPVDLPTRIALGFIRRLIAATFKIGRPEAIRPLTFVLWRWGKKLFHHERKKTRIVTPYD
jgi:hypothetical protein